MSLLGRRRRVCGMSICAKISPAGGPIPPVGGLARPRPPCVPAVARRIRRRTGSVRGAGLRYQGLSPGTTPAPLAMMSLPSPPPASENLTLLVVVLVVGIVVVLAGVAAAIVFGRSPPSPPPGSAPRVIAVNLGTSGDGANWILTFVPVPTGLSPYNTMLTILNISGATSLPATPLAYLNASGGAAYVQGQSGGLVAVGDRLLLSTTAIRPATGTGSRTVRRFSLSAPCNEPHGLGAGLRLRH